VAALVLRLLCYPSFGRVLAPGWDEAAATGAILGLTLGHRRSHILQALIEAVSYSLRENLDWLGRLIGQDITAVRAEGKLTTSRAWMQLKADVTGRRIEAVELDEATALGTALLAGVGCGLYPTTPRPATHRSASLGHGHPRLRWPPRTATSSSTASGTCRGS